MCGILCSSTAEGIVLSVRVTPRAGRNAVGGARDGMLCVRTTAPPVGGAASEAVIELVADALGLRRSEVLLIGGERSRQKRLLLRCRMTDEVAQRLADLEKLS